MLNMGFARTIPLPTTGKASVVAPSRVGEGWLVGNHGDVWVSGSDGGHYNLFTFARPSRSVEEFERSNRHDERAVRRKVAVMCQKDKTVCFGLGDNHPVEWISVDGREVHHARGTEKGHGKGTDAAIEAVGLHLGGGDRDGGRDPRVFQGDFPEGSSAEMELVSR